MEYLNWSQSFPHYVYVYVGWELEDTYFDKL